MTTAAPLAPQDYAPLWDCLRHWRQQAAEAAAQAPATLTRKQIAPLMRWIYVLEFTLRRLVLIAATALGISAPKHATRTAAHTVSGRAATTVHPAPDTFRLYPHTRPPRADAAPTTACREADDTPRQHLTHTQRYPLPVDTLLRADHQNRHDESEPLIWSDTPEQPEQHKAPAPQRAAATYATVPLIARIARLAQLIANPDQLIARAARTLAHSREIATRLALQTPPRLRGMLRTMRHLIPEILAPFHYAFADTLHRYAHANTS